MTEELRELDDHHTKAPRARRAASVAPFAGWTIPGLRIFATSLVPKDAPSSAAEAAIEIRVI